VRKKIIIICLSAAIFLLAASPILITTRVVDWWAIGPSADVLEAGNIQLHSVIGQGVAGRISLEKTEVCSGFLCLWEKVFEFFNFLPLLFR
jgi:hypothetical protein